MFVAPSSIAHIVPITERKPTNCITDARWIRTHFVSASGTKCRYAESGCFKSHPIMIRWIVKRPSCRAKADSDSDGCFRFGTVDHDK